MLIREGTPISKGDPNDFPSPRQNPKKVLAEIKKNKYGQIISSDDPNLKNKTPQKYYDSLPCTFDGAPELQNIMIQKIERVNKNFIKQIWAGTRKLPNSLGGAQQIAQTVKFKA